MIPGFSLEHADWSRVLCAERTALATAAAWGMEADTLYLSSLQGHDLSPCGACRQLLTELTPTATLWMDRGSAHPEAATPEALLPGAFIGQSFIR